MASSSSSFKIFVVVAALTLGFASPQLVWEFYDSSCPDLQDIVRDVVTDAVFLDRRMGASLLRLHFHDCFVQGCDASVLLDGTPAAPGEKEATANRNSLRGFEVIDKIKAQVEAVCPNTVSCADILAIAARDGVELVGGPRWEVPLGRRDSRTYATPAEVKANLPSPFSNLSGLITAFAAKKFSPRDLVILSGGHNIGFARCMFFRSRIYNQSIIDPAYAAELRTHCPRTGGNSNIVSLDVPPYVFDNNYYKNLIHHRGLLPSDQLLYSGVATDSIVKHFASDGAAFRRAFAEAMVRMGYLSPLTGTAGEIRRNCHHPN